MKFKPAKRSDIPSIVMMLADDELGRKREEFNNPIPKKYYDAFDAILNDKNQELIIFENDEKEIIGTLQLTFIPYLTYQGGIRAQIEAVRIHNNGCFQRPLLLPSLQWYFRQPFSALDTRTICLKGL